MGEDSHVKGAVVCVARAVCVARLLCYYKGQFNVSSHLKCQM